MPAPVPLKHRPRGHPWLGHAVALLWLTWLCPAAAQQEAAGQATEPATATAAAGAAPLPSWVELETTGVRIGRIQVRNQDIFDPTNPRERNWLFNLANTLHIRTRAHVVERALLFKPGEVVSARLIEESERLLRSSQYFYDAEFRPLAVRDGEVDILVVTRDTWSLDVGASAGRSGGANSSGLHLKDYNVFGTGTTLGISRTTNVDRSGTEIQFSNERAFGTWASVDLRHATNSDGRRDAASIARPFYALDTRWATGLSAVRDDRIDAQYDGGRIVSQYRHRTRQGEVFGGWSDGWVQGWVLRTSVGLTYQRDAYESADGLLAPQGLPADQKVVAPFLRWQWIEDAYSRQVNRNLIGRPEFFALGQTATLQLGWASERFGSTRNALLYSGRIADGFEPAPRQTLMASASLDGEASSAGLQRQHLRLQAQYYLPRSTHRLFYASAAYDQLTRPDGTDTLQLGGDNGLRGYPLRYQNGHRRALFTVEERFYTDLYLWELFRFGGAAFLDVGRAWGGADAGASTSSSSSSTGWLGNLGAGLRIVSTRTAFSNVLHVDLAFPVNAGPDVKKVQFLIKSRASF
ncbi:hypothetical protein [Sphaerotilus microaerophilus]|uniref:hypothetical protein n=1 Tax=Sphaerotilus microaerophilus TaxID=2914710 RepID=UPI002074A40E|nr:hypothetical protein [Sphaerotilus sp. FB-5]